MHLARITFRPFSVPVRSIAANTVYIPSPDAPAFWSDMFHAVRV